MTTLINIRGTNGSGKTTLIRNLMNDFAMLPWKSADKAGNPLGYIAANSKIGIIGKYEVGCGGCDTIKTQQEIKDRIDLMATNFNPKFILFEGVVVSTIFQPWYDFAAKHGGMIWAYLDTPLEVCLRRIQERNGGKEIKEDLVADKMKAIASTQRKAEAAGARTVILPYETAYDKLKEVMNG